MEGRQDHVKASAKPAISPMCWEDSEVGDSISNPYPMFEDLMATHRRRGHTCQTPKIARFREM